MLLLPFSFSSLRTKRFALESKHVSEMASSLALPLVVPQCNKCLTASESAASYSKRSTSQCLIEKSDGHDASSK